MGNAKVRSGKEDCPSSDVLNAMLFEQTASRPAGSIPVRSYLYTGLGEEEAGDRRLPVALALGGTASCQTAIVPILGDADREHDILASRPCSGFKPEGNASLIRLMMSSGG